MRRFLPRFLIVVGLAALTGCVATNEIYSLPPEWSNSLPTSSRILLSGIYDDISPDLISNTSFNARLYTTFLWKKTFRDYDGSKGPYAFIKIVENPTSLEVTVMNREHVVIATHLLKKDTDYVIDGLGIKMTHSEDLRSGEGGSVVQLTDWIAKRTDGVLLVRTTSVSKACVIISGGGVFEQWYRFNPPSE